MAEAYLARINQRTGRSEVPATIALVKRHPRVAPPALMTAVEALVATGVKTMIDSRDGYTPTPVISCAILGYNRSHTHVLADGLVITPSHNPPTDGGLKCNPPHGGRPTRRRRD